MLLDGTCKGKTLFWYISKTPIWTPNWSLNSTKYSSWWSLFLGFLCTCFDQLEREIGIDSLKSDLNHSIKRKAKPTCMLSPLHPPSKDMCRGPYPHNTSMHHNQNCQRKEKDHFDKSKICYLDSLAGVFFSFGLPPMLRKLAMHHLVLFKMSMISWPWKWSWYHSKQFSTTFSGLILH